MREEDLRYMALCVIEHHICEANEPTQEMLDFLYRVTHTARSVECRVNHPQWTEELIDAYKEITGRENGKES